MQPLVIAEASITPFQIKLTKAFQVGGATVYERSGFYLDLVTDEGLRARGEAAPLPGVSPETFKKVQHDLEEIKPILGQLKASSDAKEMIHFLRHFSSYRGLCLSAKFALESALFSLGAQSAKLSLAEYLGAPLEDVACAGLLQGSFDQVMADATQMVARGQDLFKLKVGDRNIPLDIKKLSELRKLIGEDGLIRLDANRAWSLKEAVLFAELAGHQKIEFIEEPLSDISQLNEFYEKTHLPVALDETLGLMRCGVTAPGRCSPTLANHPAVQAYVLKPTILGGLIPTLDWIEEARSTGRKAIISSAYESPVGLKVLANLSLLTGQVAGLGTSRWLESGIVNDQGIIPKEFLR